VGGRIFAVAPLEPAALILSFKCNDEEFAELIERPGIVPAPYLARAKWVALESENTLARSDIERLLVTAHALVFAKLPKKLQVELAVRSKKLTSRRNQPKRRKLATRRPRRKKS